MSLGKWVKIGCSQTRLSENVVGACAAILESQSGVDQRLRAELSLLTTDFRKGQIEILWAGK
jgi:hypothetical protein